MDKGTEDRLLVLGSLIAIGSRGRKGQRLLGRIKKVAGWSFLVFLVIGFAILFAARAFLTLNDPSANGLVAIIFFSWLLSVLGGALWCYAAIAKWMTDDEEDGYDDDE